MLAKRIINLWRSLSSFFQPLYRRLILIVVVGFLARLVVYGFIKTPWIIYDEYLYMDTARQIARGNFLSQMSRDAQQYPAGWPLMLSAIGGIIRNPEIQYRVMLTFNMFVSSLIPVLVYFLTGSLWVGLVMSFYPPLFVYSSSIMSETFYTFMLLAVITMIKYIIKDDLRKYRTLVLASFVLGFFLYYTRIVRSVGLILIPAFGLTTAFILYLQAKEKAWTTLKQLLYFSVLTVFSYYLVEYILKHTLFSKTVFYEKTPYIQALKQALLHPRLSFTLLRNELTLSLFFLYFFLPVFSVHEFLKEFHKREWHLLFPRIMTWFVYIGSLILTFAHMYIGTKHNPQYLVFSRYLDPALVLLAAFGLRDFLSYLEIKAFRVKLPGWVYLVAAYCLFYLAFRLSAIDYKFGNTMPVFFFLDLKANHFGFWPVILFVTLLYYFLHRSQKLTLVVLFSVFFVWSSILSINGTRSTPDWVQNKYQALIGEWQAAMHKYPTTDVPLCIYKDGISTEVFYLYHYLYPYQYLKSCAMVDHQPKRILTEKTSLFNLPTTCVRDFKFSTNESIFFCPLGVK